MQGYGLRIFGDRGSMIEDVGFSLHERPPSVACLEQRVSGIAFVKDTPLPPGHSTPMANGPYMDEFGAKTDLYPRAVTGKSSLTSGSLHPN